MRFLIDEDVAIEIDRALRHAGHEVELVFESLGPTTSDGEIWSYAISRQAILITCNRADFLALAGTSPETGDNSESSP